MQSEAPAVTSARAALSPEEVRRYHERGFLFPLDALSPEEVACVRGSVQDFLSAGGGDDPRRRQDPHLYLKWVADLVLHPAILDRVEQVLGPDVLLWRSVFFVKAAGDARYVAWHQDSTYWGLQGDAVATAWLALSDSTVENGCVRVVPASHRAGTLPHRLRFDPDNALLRGQSLAVDVPEETAVDMTLRAGQFSLHHFGLVHGSGPNRSDAARVGLALRFLAPDVRPPRPGHLVVLVRGEDRHRHYEHGSLPRREGDPDAQRLHARALDAYSSAVVREVLLRPSPARLRALARILWRRGGLRAAAAYVWRGVSAALPGRRGRARG